MINFMQIRNMALVESADVDFSNGINVISGETGSGKSVVISALKFIFGEKTNTSIIRQGESSCEVSISINKNSLIDEIATELDCVDSEYLLKRILSKNGISKSFLNEKVVPLSVLKKIGKGVVFCSQFENQTLLDPKNTINIIDLFLDNKSTLHDYKEKYYSYLTSIKKLNELKEIGKEKDSRLDYIKYVYNEIDSVNPKKDEDKDLEDKLRENKDNEKIRSFLLQAEHILYDQDSILSKLEDLNRKLKDLKIRESLVESTDNAINSLESFGNLILKTKKHYNGYSDMREIESRLSKLKGLKRKYGGTLDLVIEKKFELESQIKKFESIDSEISDTELEIENKKESLFLIANKLTIEREAVVLNLSKEVSEKIQDMNMPGATISFKLSKRLDFSEEGFDYAEIIFSPNKGEKILPIQNIASGGELSRVALGLYQVIGNKLGSDCYIFDEIDSGIGGKTANSVAKSLIGLSKISQVITVTHLPQITECGETNIRVEKREIGGRTYTNINVLSESEKTEELQRMRFGG